MEKTLKEAADSLLQKNKITQEEYDSLDMEKNGSGPLRTFMGKVMSGAGKAINKTMEYGTGAAILATTGYMAKEMLVDPIVNTIQINNSYKKLIEKTPQLQSQDPNVIKDYFNIIKTYSPKAASNPLVAGALINKMVEFGGIDHKLVMDLMDMQAKVPNIAVPAILAAGAKTMANPEVTTMVKPMEIGSMTNTKDITNWKGERTGSESTTTKTYKP